MQDFLTNRSFGAAAAQAFGLNPGAVTRAELNTANMDQPFAITFEVILTPMDLVRIGKIMNMAGDDQPAVPAQTGTLDRQVQHVDTSDEEPAGIPPHVYLYKNMCTPLQQLAPLGIDETNGQYAVAIDDLTPEQCCIPHVVKQLDEIFAEKLRANNTPT